METNNPFIQKRLDYWLISDARMKLKDLILFLRSTPTILAIFLHFSSKDKPEHDHSLRKFNAGLVDDDDFVAD